MDEKILINKNEPEMAQLSSDDMKYLEMIDFLNMLEELEGK